MKKGIFISIVAIGAVLFLMGVFIKIPSKELRTFTGSEDKYSVIDEYVGGDAYNYIIGASLVGGEIAGAKTQKAIFISVGLLIICLGLCSFKDMINDEDDVEKGTYHKDFMKYADSRHSSLDMAGAIIHTDFWICKECKAKNDISDCYCINCGAQK